jgi:hypothetical protein
MIEFVDFEEGAALDLVAHFLGIATHDNINAAPSCLARLADNGDEDVSQPAIVTRLEPGIARLVFAPSFGMPTEEVGVLDHRVRREKVAPLDGLIFKP